MCMCVDLPILLNWNRLWERKWKNRKMTERKAGTRKEFCTSLKIVALVNSCMYKFYLPFLNKKMNHGSWTAAVTDTVCLPDVF